MSKTKKDESANTAIAPAGPAAYCRSCQSAGMSNCAHFNECSGATCITCHRPLNVPALAAAPQDGEALARTKADQQWAEWSSVLRRLIGDRTEKLHFAADVQATEDGVYFDNCRFIHAKPVGYIHIGQYVESCDADERHAGWQPVWTSKPQDGEADQPVGDDTILRDAMRYRWLRDRGPVSPAQSPCAYTFPPNHSFPYPIGGDGLDAACDTAIAAAAGDESQVDA